MSKCDFSGWAIRTDLDYAGKRIIHQNAFAGDDGYTVPLVWIHGDCHYEIVLGYARLRSKDEGVYAYCTFIDTSGARRVNEMIRRGDICALSCYATGIEQDHGNILRGSIKEVSFVLAGANPRASIIYTNIQHGEEAATEALIYTNTSISHKHVDVPEMFLS